MGWRINVHDEEGSVSRPSVLSDEIFQNVDQNICERQCFTISELSYKFPTNFTHYSLRDYQI
jgi:hypothetical protein